METKQIYRIDIPVKVDTSQILKRLKLRNGSNRFDGMALEMAQMALEAAHPKAIFQASHAKVIDRSTVEIDGIRFTSRALSKCLVDQDIVYPIIATAGHELDALPVDRQDIMRQYCLDVIKMVILFAASEYLTEHIKEKFSLGGTAYLNPGEFDDFPVTQQKPLFMLFSGAEKQIGVTLTKGGAMKPEKSRTGILFPIETGFLSCRLCTQFRCPGRQAAYDPVEVEKYIKNP